MKKSLVTGLFVGLQVLGLAGMSIVSTGCSSDNFTYAEESQKHGLKLYSEGNYTESAAAFRNATRQQPKDYKSFYYLACCYDQLKQYQQATSFYRSSLQAMPLTYGGQHAPKFRAKVIEGLALSISRSGTSQLETTQLEQKVAVSADPEDLLLLAKIYRYTGDPDAAVEAYSRLSLLSPKDFAVQKEFGLYLEQLAQNERASVQLRKAFALDTKDEQVNSALGRLGVTIMEVPPGAPSVEVTRVPTEPSPVPAGMR